MFDFNEDPPIPLFPFFHLPFRTFANEKFFIVHAVTCDMYQRFLIKMGHDLIRKWNSEYDKALSNDLEKKTNLEFRCMFRLHAMDLFYR